MGFAVVVNVNALMPLLMVKLAGDDDPAPPPEAVARLVTVAAFNSASVMAWAAVQVTVAFEARVVPALPQLNGVALIRVSVTVN